jgi:hypothetical protein
MALQFAMAIPMALNVARVISQQGVKAAIKRFGPEAAKLINKNMNKLRKRFPEIFGPQSKSRMDPPRNKMVKEKYMDDKGRFYSDKAAKELKDQAAINRRAIGAGAAVVGGGAVLLTGNEDKDSSIVQSAAANKGSRDSLRRYEAKSQLSRQKELDAVGPGPDMKKRSSGPTKNNEDRRVTKSVPKTVDTKPRRKTSVESMTNEEIKRGMGSKKKAAQKSGDTTPQRKKPGRFSEENVKRVMKEKFGIDVTYDKGDELDPLVARGEEPGRKKGGMVQFTKRGGMYNKPARKNSKG